ncbi:MAG: hypothetical protein AAF628_08240 [Planctomycetota bacterium]
MDKSDIQTARKLIDTLCEEMEREAPLHNVQLFLHIAEAQATDREVDVRALQESSGLTSAACSRALGAIGEWSYKNRPGLDLVTSRADYSDRRRKVMVLTKTGEKLANKITRILGR